MKDNTHCKCSRKLTKGNIAFLSIAETSMNDMIVGNGNMKYLRMIEQQTNELISKNDMSKACLSLDE